MRTAQAVAIADIYQDPAHSARRLPADVRAEPADGAGTVEDPVAAIGAYWADARATDAERQILETLARAASLALSNVQLFIELQRHLAGEQEARRAAEAGDRRRNRRQPRQGSVPGDGVARAADPAERDAGVAVATPPAKPGDGSARAGAGHAGAQHRPPVPSRRRSAGRLAGRRRPATLESRLVDCRRRAGRRRAVPGGGGRQGRHAERPGRNRRRSWSGATATDSSRSRGTSSRTRSSSRRAADGSRSWSGAAATRRTSRCATPAPARGRVPPARLRPVPPGGRTSARAYGGLGRPDDRAAARAAARRPGRPRAPARIAAPSCASNCRSRPCCTEPG